MGAFWHAALELFMSCTSLLWSSKQEGESFVSLRSFVFIHLYLSCADTLSEGRMEAKRVQTAGSSHFHDSKTGWVFDPRLLDQSFVHRFCGGEVGQEAEKRRAQTKEVAAKQRCELAGCGIIIQFYTACLVAGLAVCLFDCLLSLLFGVSVGCIGSTRSI